MRIKNTICTLDYLNPSLDTDSVDQLLLFLEELEEESTQKRQMLELI